MSRQGLPDYLVTMLKPSGRETPDAPQVVYDGNGEPSYLVTVRKPGQNPEPIAHTAEEFPVAIWQRRASPVWVRAGTCDESRTKRVSADEVWSDEGTAAEALVAGLDPDGFLTCDPDINPSETLQYRSAREEKDERHVAPLQTEVV